ITVLILVFAMCSRAFNASFIILRCFALFLFAPRPSLSTLFPYTTLFRSLRPRPEQDFLPSPAAGGPPRETPLPRRRYGPHLHKIDRKSTRLNSSHVSISYAVFCLKKKKLKRTDAARLS